MSLQCTAEPQRRRGSVDRPGRPEEKAPRPPRSAIRMTCRDILAEARNRLSALGFSWFEPCAGNALPGRLSRGTGTLDRNERPAPSQMVIEETQAGRAEPLEAGRV